MARATMAASTTTHATTPTTARYAACPPPEISAHGALALAETNGAYGGRRHTVTIAVFPAVPPWGAQACYNA